MPGFIKPQLAILKDKAPSGAQWIHEIKFDGYRTQVHVDKGTARIFTRNGHDWTRRFSAIAGSFKLRSQTIFDGEVVVIHEGRTNFSELQADLAKGRQDCVSAWNKDPVFGVIGIQSGPRDKGPQWLPSSHGSRGWDAGGGDDW
ncbi:ATP-dependent DNA ligase [Bradyrhizobium liaoningense]